MNESQAIKTEIIRRAIKSAIMVELVQDCICVNQEPNMQNKCTGCGTQYMEVRL